MNSGPAGFPGLVVRRMTANDLDAVVAIAASLEEAPHWNEPAYLTAIHQESTPKRIALVAEEPDTGKIAGFLIASLLGPESELETIGVALEDQRRGIGGALITALLDEAKSAEVLHVLLEVRESNRKAIDFYRSRGWRESGRRSHYYTDPEEDAVLMSLRLA
jgi:ribosomal-protein-alanine acetyltransferase